MKQTAVVILNYNGAGMLRRFLPSVIKSSPEASIYVADNGSSDESCDVVRNEFPAVKLMVLDHNYGFAEGYNRALAQVDEEYAVLLNSDVEVTRGWLSPMTQFLDSNPEVAACQPNSFHSSRKTSLNTQEPQEDSSTNGDIPFAGDGFSIQLKETAGSTTTQPMCSGPPGLPS